MNMTKIPKNKQGRSTSATIGVAWNGEDDKEPVYDHSVPNKFGNTPRSESRHMRNQRLQGMTNSVGEPAFMPRLRNSPPWEPGQCNEAANLPKLFPTGSSGGYQGEHCIKC